MRKNPRDLIDDLLEYAVKYAELNAEPETGACWGVIEEARAYLRKTSRPGVAAKRDRVMGHADKSQRAHVLASLRADGMMIDECIQALAAPRDDPYVAAAHAASHGSDTVQIDDQTVTSASDGGTWVLAWLWVCDGQAGLTQHSAMLEEVLNRARRALAGASGLDAEVRGQLENQAAWLEDLLANHAEEIDAIDSARPGSEPGAILWIDGQGRDMLLMPSDALRKLLEVAKLAGLDIPHAQHCEWFCRKYGDTLDAVLSVIRLG